MTGSEEHRSGPLRCARIFCRESAERHVNELSDDPCRAILERAEPTYGSFLSNETRPGRARSRGATSSLPQPNVQPHRGNPSRLGASSTVTTTSRADSSTGRSRRAVRSPRSGCRATGHGGSARPTTAFRSSPWCRPTTRATPSPPPSGRSGRRPAAPTTSSSCRTTAPTTPPRSPRPPAPTSCGTPAVTPTRRPGPSTSRSITSSRTWTTRGTGPCSSWTRTPPSPPTSSPSPSATWSPGWAGSVAPSPAASARACWATSSGWSTTATPRSPSGWPTARSYSPAPAPCSPTARCSTCAASAGPARCCRRGSRSTTRTASRRTTS